MSMYAINQTSVQKVGSNPAAGSPRPYLRLVPPPSSRPARTSAAVFRRRRVAVLLGFAALVLATMVFVGAPAPETTRAGSTAPVASTQAARQDYVVRQGDTLWAIARRLRPDGDVRPVVDRLADQRRGAPLRVGERIKLPGDG